MAAGAEPKPGTGLAVGEGQGGRIPRAPHLEAGRGRPRGAGARAKAETGAREDPRRDGSGGRRGRRRGVDAKARPIWPPAGLRQSAAHRSLARRGQELRGGAGPCTAGAWRAGSRDASDRTSILGVGISEMDWILGEVTGGDPRRRRPPSDGLLRQRRGMRGKVWRRLLGGGAGAPRSRPKGDPEA